MCSFAATRKPGDDLRPLLAALAASFSLASPALAPAGAGVGRRGCTSRTCRARVQAKIDARRPLHWAIASYYGPADSGGALACGGGDLTSSTIGVANRTLPCGTRLRVCARRCLMVRVIDRGPFVAGRDYDLTIATARAIGFDLAAGVGRIRVG